MNLVNLSVFWFWQLPQHLLALALIGIFKLSGRIADWKEEIFALGQTYSVIWIDCQGFAVSLGQYIIIDRRHDDNEIKHEKGHCLQSLVTGPLYLLIIGLPSALANNVWDRIFHQKWSNKDRRKWYYSRFPEKSADKLGGAVRNRD